MKMSTMLLTTVARPKSSSALLKLGRLPIHRSVSNQVHKIRTSRGEVQTGRLTERSLEEAVRSILQDGIVVIENVIDHDHLDKLNDRMVIDSIQLSNMGEKSPFNYNQGNLQQDAPPIKEYFEPSIFLSRSAS